MPVEARPARELLPLVYDELRRLAAQRLSREAPGQTLQATALVHEAYLRLVGVDPDRPWDGRGHFFAAAAESMRRILVENARRRHRLKRGGDRARVDLDAAEPAAPETDDDLLALDEALERLAAEGPGQGRARPAPRLRRLDPGPGGRDPRPVDLHGRPVLGLCPGLAPRRDRGPRSAGGGARSIGVRKIIGESVRYPAPGRRIVGRVASQSHERGPALVE